MFMRSGKSENKLAGNDFIAVLCLGIDHGGLVFHLVDKRTLKESSGDWRNGSVRTSYEKSGKVRGCRFESCITRFFVSRQKNSVESSAPPLSPIFHLTIINRITNIARHSTLIV